MSALHLDTIPVRPDDFQRVKNVSAHWPIEGGCTSCGRPNRRSTTLAPLRARLERQRKGAVGRKIRISRKDLERVVKEALEDNPDDETAKRLQRQLLKNPKKQLWEFDWIFDVGE